MSATVLVFICSLLMNACVYNAVQTEPAKPEQITYDTRGFTKLFFYDGIAQGCPVGPNVLLTARHVAVRENGITTPQNIAATWSTKDGTTGSAWGVDYDYRRDVAIMHTDVPLPFVYKVAEKAPQVGERIIMAGYEYRTGLEKLAERTIETEIIRIVANTLILKEPPVNGFSGSCVLDFKSEVVGILTAAIGTEDGAVGVAPVVAGTWADVGWIPPPERQAPVLPSRPLP